MLGAAKSQRPDVGLMAYSCCMEGLSQGILQWREKVQVADDEPPQPATTCDQAVQACIEAEPASGCLTQVDFECQEVEAARQRLTSQLEESTQELQRVEVEVKRAFLDIEAASEELRVRRIELARKQEEAAQLRQELAHDNQELVLLRKDAQTASAEASDLRASLKLALLEVSNLTVALQKAQEEKSDLRRQMDEVSSRTLSLMRRPDPRGNVLPTGARSPSPTVPGLPSFRQAVVRRTWPKAPVPPQAGSRASTPSMAEPPEDAIAGDPCIGGRLTPKPREPPACIQSPLCPPSSSITGTPGRSTPSRRVSVTTAQQPASGGADDPSKIEQARAAVRLAETRHGEMARETLQAATDLALLLEELGPGSTEAGSLLRWALSGYESQCGMEHLDTLRAANNLAVFLDNSGERQEALQLYRRSATGRMQQLGSSHPYTLDSLFNLGCFLWQDGQVDEAEQILREVQENCLRVFGPCHHGTLDCSERLAELLEARGSLQEAESLCRNVLAGRKEVQGACHVDILRTYVTMASVLTAAGRTHEAEEAHRCAVERHGEALGLDDPATLELTHNLAVFLENNGKAPEAELVFRSALSACELAFGASTPVVLTYLDNLAILLERRGERAEAETLFRRALQSRSAKLGWDHEDTLRSATNLAMLLDNTNQQVKATQLYRQALAGYQRTLGEEHEKTLDSKYSLAMHLADRGEADEAAQLLDAIVGQLDGQEGEDWVLPCLRRLGELQRDRNELVAAEGSFRRALEKLGTPSGPEAADVAHNLALVLARQNRQAEAEPLFRAALQGYAAKHTSDDTYHLDAVFSLGCCMESLGRPEEAQELYQRAAAGRRRTLGANDAATCQAESALAVCQARHQAPKRLPLLPDPASLARSRLVNIPPQQQLTEPSTPTTDEPSTTEESCVEALKEAYAQKHDKLQEQISQLQFALHELRNPAKEQQPSTPGHTSPFAEPELATGPSPRTPEPSPLRKEPRLMPSPPALRATWPSPLPMPTTSRENGQNLHFFRVGYDKARSRLHTRPAPATVQESASQSWKPPIVSNGSSPPSAYCAAVAGFESASR